ncbi:theronine dehydrogenase-like Zn-dependent dehydrogenase [Saccharomonospora xinjiangensis XJ-54]|uniref:Theronine dehydrogenase-like Zn-dependent dehydrogenase n=1 Tax=Saccharomonospora xinjiangensis XJ-54 TaxID=882086 RepID=I0UY53_9PSEU|nr:theronine dehydrogenase-like Zn-dependent dehydrogenase [Saccharomonospora xinjiangensis XJ-54]
MPDTKSDVNTHGWNWGLVVRAYVMDGPGRIRLSTVDDPVCGPDEILLATEAVSVCSTDISYFKGHLFPTSWPIIPGHEYVGEVVEVGSSLTGRVGVGQRITYWGQTDFGGMAELRAIRPIFAHDVAARETSWYTTRNFYDADQAAAVAVPDTMDSTAATIVEPLTSVLRSLLINPPRPGDSCVVLGCGPSAQLAIQVLTKVLGAGSVTAVDRVDPRLALSRHNGARLTFNTTTDGPALEQFVHDHQDEFADYVFDALPNVAVGDQGKDVRELAMGLLRPGGLYVIYGATEVPQHISTWLILAKGLHLRATPFDVRLFPMQRSAHVAQVAMTLIDTGVIDVGPVVSDHIDFGDEDAVRRAFAGYGTAGSMKFSLLTPVARTRIEATNTREGELVHAGSGR